MHNATGAEYNRSAALVYLPGPQIPSMFLSARGMPRFNDRKKKNPTWPYFGGRNAGDDSH
jgi:hypothetical protein